MIRAMSEPRPRVAIVAGPTASGKSAAALALAEQAGGTVINADSMQVYRELRILTARPNDADLARAPHRLYGTLPAAEACSAGRWLDLAAAEVNESLAAGHLPILVGGTGLYLRALMEGLAPVPPVTDPVRAEARALFEKVGGTGLHERLLAVDPVMAARLAPGDSQRLIRAWEVWCATGRSLADWQAEPAQAPPLPPLWFRILVLLPGRDAAYAAIDGRFEQMIAAGALEEVRALDALGLDPALPAMKAHGVPALRAHLAGTMSLEEAVRIGQRDTRRYAKRQRTWLRHQLIDRADTLARRNAVSINLITAQYSDRLSDDIRTFILD